MKRILITLAIWVVASYAFAECPTEDTVIAFGRPFRAGGLVGMLRDDSRDCDARDQPAWLAKINETASSNTAAPPKAASNNAAPKGLAYCREIVRNKDSQNDAQRRDCIFWYGHSIEVQ
jgi:hypothetical protein